MERGNLDYPIYRDDYAPQFLEMYEGDEVTNTPIDVLAQFDDILIQIRQNKKPVNSLVKTLQYTAGTIAITDTNKVSWDMTMTSPAGAYWYDIRFKIKGSNNWITYIEGNVLVTNNVSKA